MRIAVTGLDSPADTYHGVPASSSTQSAAALRQLPRIDQMSFRATAEAVRSYSLS